MSGREYSSLLDPALEALLLLRLDLRFPGYALGSCLLRNLLTDINSA